MNGIPVPRLSKIAILFWTSNFTQAEVPDFILGDFKLSPGSGVVWVEQGELVKTTWAGGSDGDVSFWKVFESGEDQLMWCFGGYLQFLFKQVAILSKLPNPNHIKLRSILLCEKRGMQDMNKKGGGDTASKNYMLEG